MKRSILIFTLLFLLFALENSSCNKNKQKYLVDARDDKTYKTIEIGNQIWMAENLAFYVDSGCWAYNNEQDSVFKYGYLYDWKTAQDICPEGWHLPSKEDFEELKQYLKDNNFHVYKSLIFGGESGFNGYLTGDYDNNTFDLKNIYTAYWTTTEHYTDYGWTFYLYEKDKVGTVVYAKKEYGSSVRCIKDN